MKQQLDLFKLGFCLVHLLTHLHCESSVPELRAIITLHLQTILSYPQVIVDARDVTAIANNDGSAQMWRPGRAYDATPFELFGVWVL